MQFGYKGGNSTTLCAVLYFTEIISHYINNGSCVYACLFDDSKAFDRVYYGKLFNIILLSKYIPKCIVQLIFHSYLRQGTCVICNSVKSDFFKTYIGVKQGVFYL